MGARRPQILSGVDERTGGSNSTEEIGDGERIRVVESRFPAPDQAQVFVGVRRWEGDDGRKLGQRRIGIGGGENYENSPGSFFIGTGASALLLPVFTLSRVPIFFLILIYEKKCKYRYLFIY
jgi:hypothetical protein